MSLFSRRSLLLSALFVGLLPTSLIAADKPKEIRLDWATYNPVSMVLKEQGLLEKEFAKDGIAIRWVQTLGSNKALEFLAPARSISARPRAPLRSSPRSTAIRSSRSMSIRGPNGPRW